MNPVETYFDHVSQSYDQNCQSGIWGWIKRREREAVRGFLSDRPIENALDLGCGGGFYGRLLLDKGARHLTCVDISQAMLDQIHGLACLKICADIENFLVPTKFDAIICAGAVEFLPDPEKLLSNVQQMLASNGTFVLLLPRRHSLNYFYRRFHQGNGLHVRLFDQLELESVLASLGMQIDQVRHPVPTTTVLRISHAS